MKPTVAALLLAAGRSRRMGSPKPLLPLEGKPVISHCCEVLRAAGLDLTVVVRGDDLELLALLRESGAAVALNHLPASQMGDSVRLGLAMIPAPVTGILVCLADHPLVAIKTIRRLRDCHYRHPDRSVIPVFKGKKGHPTLFPRQLLEQVHSGANLRQLLDRHREQVVLLPVDDPGVTLDMDTPADYLEVCRLATMR